MLGLLEGTGYEKPGAGSAASTHYLAEAMRRAYADRAEFLGDPDFAHIPVQGLLNPRYLAGCARPSIRLARPQHGDRAWQRTAVRIRPDDHFNVIDAEGNAVALTIR